MGEASTLIARKSSELFYRNGFATVPVEGIIEHSGVSRRTFYRYFKDKEDVVCAALRYRSEQFCEMLRLEAGKQSSLSGTVAAIFEGLIEWHRRHGYHGCLFQAAVSQYGPHSRRIREISRAHKAEFEGFVAQLLTEKGHPEANDFAAVIALLVEGAVALGHFGEPVAHIRRAQSTALHLL